MRHRFFASSVFTALATCGLLFTNSACAFDEAYKVSPPIIHGNLAIYPLRGPTIDLPAPLTLDAALASGEARIFEQDGGKYAIDNLSNRELFIQAGDLIHGGSQDQVAAVGVLVPPGAHAYPVTFFCVERYRSAPAAGQGTSDFSGAGMIPSQVARLTLLSNTQTSRTAELLQRIGVWLSVESFTSALSRNLGIASTPSSRGLPMALEDATLRDAQQPFVDALGGLAASSKNMTGAVFAINGTIYGAEIYSSSELLRAMWPKLLRGFVAQAVVLQGLPKTTAPSSDDVAVYLTNAETSAHGRTLHAVTRQANGAWVHKQSVTSVEGTGTELENALLRALDSSWSPSYPAIDIGTANPKRFQEAVLIDGLTKRVADPKQAIAQAKRAGLPFDPMQVARDGTSASQSPWLFILLAAVGFGSWVRRRRRLAHALRAAPVIRRPDDVFGRVGARAIGHDTSVPATLQKRDRRDRAAQDAPPRGELMEA